MIDFVARRRSLFIGLLIAAWLVLLTVRPMAENDEFRYAEIAREMLQSGDWVVPRLSGIRYFEKPVLGHWWNAISLAVLGETPLAARLPAALATILTAAFLAFFIRRATGEAAAGRLSAFVYLSTVFVWAVGSIAILDPLFSLPVTVAIGSWYLSWAHGSVAGRRGWLIVSGLACGAAFLTKGFLGLALPAVVIAPFLIWQRDWRRMLADPWLPMLMALLVVAPWAAAIHFREPDFWRYFFWEEHVRRFFGQQDAQHTRPFWLFLAVLPGLALPWTFAVPAALSGLRRCPVNRPLIGFLSMWFALPFLLLSLSSGKLLTYVLPCFPPLAGLIALGLLRYEAGGRGELLRRGAGALAVVLFAGAAFLLVTSLGIAGRSLYGSGEMLRATLAIIALVLGAATAGIAAIGRLSEANRRGVFGCVLLGLFLAVPIALPEDTRTSKMPEAFLARLAQQVKDPIVVAHGSLVRSASWTFKTTEVFVLDPGELRYGLRYPDSAHRLVTAADVGALVRSTAGRRPVLIIAPDRESELLQTVLGGRHPIDRYGEDLAWIIPANR